MTQARLSPILGLKLTPLIQPEASLNKGGELTGLATEPESVNENTNLLVQPGKSSQIVLHINNHSQEQIQLQIEVKGNFPSSWCQWHSEGQLLRQNQEMLIGVNFLVPADFFESDQIISPNLDYQSVVYVYYQINGGSNQYLETITFNFYIRPHSLYLQFLPSIYREIDFIGRFLKIFEQAFEPTVKGLEAMWGYLDPHTAPKTLLPFLAHWVGWEMIPNLDVFRQRRLIANAIEIYRWRGTKKGLRFYLHLYTNLPLDEELTESNKHICIEEMSGNGFVLGNAHLGQETFLGGGRPYHFIVRLKQEFSGQINESLVRLIIEQEKPAWCTYELYLEEPV